VSVIIAPEEEANGTIKVKILARNEEIAIPRGGTPNNIVHSSGPLLNTSPTLFVTTAKRYSRVQKTFVMSLSLISLTRFIFDREFVSNQFCSFRKDKS
jgi:hypothetical protein